MKKISLAILVLFLGACAHHRDVRPGADGVHKVVVMAEETEHGSRDALSQANHFCKERNLAAAIVEEKSNYQGSVDEASYKKGKAVSKAAKAAGGALHVFGGKNESAVGGVTAITGGITDGMLGKGYSVEMKFKCQ